MLLKISLVIDHFIPINWFMKWSASAFIASIINFIVLCIPAFIHEMEILHKDNKGYWTMSDFLLKSFSKSFKHILKKG